MAFQAALLVLLVGILDTEIMHSLHKVCEEKYIDRSQLHRSLNKSLQLLCHICNARVRISAGKLCSIAGENVS